MWFDIIPTFIIMVAAMGAPHAIAYGLNWLVVGNCYRRELLHFNQRIQYLRDRRLTGNSYKLAGLENIPDEGDEGNDEEECEDDNDNKTEGETCQKETTTVTGQNEGDDGQNKGDAWQNKGDDGQNKGDAGQNKEDAGKNEGEAKCGKPF